MDTVRARQAALGLGWFSIGLGMAQLFGARAIADRLGIRRGVGMMRLCGVREIANGVGILAAKDPAPWMWGRVAGDALDVAGLVACFEDSPRKNALTAVLAGVAGITVMDVMTAQALSKAGAPTARRIGPSPDRDYSTRSGFPMGVEAARGLARRDFEAPQDMRIPRALQPRQLH